MNTQKKDKNINIENPELEERDQDIIVTIRKAAAKKEIEAHDTRNSAKDQNAKKKCLSSCRSRKHTC